jgi:hypothetical protein
MVLLVQGQRLVSKDVQTRIKKILSVVIANCYSIILQSMHLCQTKYKMFECSHAATYNIYTLVRGRNA